MKALIADDEPVSRRLLESSLTRWGYDVVVARDGLEAWQMLQQDDAPTLVVLDWLMPGLNGVELCREIRARELQPYTYIMLLTVKREQDSVLEGLEAGADDFVTKPFDPKELKVRLRTGTRLLFLLDQLVAARDSLRDLATHDSLTGCWNRRTILETLGNEINRAYRQKSSVGVVFIDLDNFKSINDTHGHLAGDRVLREAAHTMAALARPYDSLGRYGGEEFLLILPGCDRMNAVSHAGRMRLALADHVVKTSTVDIRFTASFGVTVAERDARADLNGLIQAADAAMYRAKRAGRNRVEFAAFGESLLASAG